MSISMMGYLPIQWKEFYRIALLYIAASILLTYPLCLRMGTEFPVGGDSWQNNWNLWWTSQAMSDPDLHLLQCPLLFYPEGLSLALHSNSYFNTFLSLPFQCVFSLSGIHYFLIWVYFPLSAIAAYILARRWIRFPPAAFMAGWIYAFSPYRMGRYMIEQVDILSTAFIPLFLLCALEFFSEPRWRAVFWASLFLTLQLFSSWYNGAFCLLFLTFLFLYKWFAEELPWKVRKFWLGLGIMVLISALALAPLMISMFQDLSSPLFATQVDQIEVSKATSSDLLAYGTPNVMYPSSWDQAFRGHGPVPRSLIEKVSARILKGRGSNILEATCYIGWVNLYLFALCLIRLYRRTWPESQRKNILFWVVATLVFGILSLGPVLQIAGWNTGMPLPYLFINLLPGFSILRAPVRLAILVTLALGICIAFLLDHWMVTGKKRLAIMMCVLIAIDLALFPLHRLYEGRPIPEVYQQIAQDSEPGAVVEIPSGYHFSSSMKAAWYNVRAMYYQTQHGRPLLIGYISRTPQDPYRMLERFPVIRALSQECLTKQIPVSEIDITQARNNLIALNVRYVVLHPENVLDITGGDESEVIRVRQLLEQITGAPIQEGGETVTYRIDEGSLIPPP